MPVRNAMISAQMAMAVSSGVLAPMSRPIGPMTRAMPSSETPASCSRALRLSVVRRDPMAPRYPTRVSRADTIAGTSNLGSWVSTQMASRGPSNGPTSARYLSGHDDHDLVGHREPGPGGEHRPGVAYRDPVAEDLGHLDQSGGEIDGTEDDHAGRRGERLDEDRDVTFARLAVQAVVPGAVSPAASSPSTSRATTRSRSGSPRVPRTCEVEPVITSSLAASRALGLPRSRPGPPAARTGWPRRELRRGWSPVQWTRRRPGSCRRR